MRFQVLALDYDGTLAHHGLVDEETVAALERVRASGRKLVLVSGRELSDLRRVFPHLHLFHLAVLENGGILHVPGSKETRRLAQPPPEEFVATLRRRGVGPISVGEVIVATWEPHDVAVLDTIRELGLELQVIFNKGAVMVLPSGVNKASGLKAALAELRLSPHNAVGVGDAENDHAFLDLCECSVAVSNALPSLKERADVVTVGDHGAGVRELIDALVGSDLRELEGRLGRHALLLGTTADGGRLTFSPFSPPLLVTGTSGGGKSTLATSIIEQLADRGYQFCILDPEGDYRDLAGATVLGTEGRVPGADEVIQVLEKPDQSVVVNMIGVTLGDRPAFFDTMFSRLFELLTRTGRPHWIFLDEAHHLAPGEGKPPLLPTPLDGLLLITVHPEHVARSLLQAVETVLVIGTPPRETLAGFAAAVGVSAPDVPAEPLPPGEAIVWQVRTGAPPVRIRAAVEERYTAPA